MVLCIDAGTTRLKAAILDDAGGTVAAAACAIGVLHPEWGAAEMDMPALWQTLCDCTLALAEQAPQAMSALSGVGICAQGDGLWPLTAGGLPARNAILWCDNRAGVLGHAGDELLVEFVRQQQATALFPGAMPSILAWLKQREPGSYQGIAHALHCKDWLNYCLTGQIVSDYSDQSAAGLDIFRRAYAAPLFDRLGIPEARGMLPPLRASTALLGGVMPEAAAQCGIPAGTPVVAGCMDVIASALGAGVQEWGDGCAILGTTLCSQVLITQEQVDMRDTRGSALCGAGEGVYHRVMAAQSGTAALDWARSILCPDWKLGEVDAALGTIPPGCEGVLFQPYIQGERAPFRAHGARGAFHGLRGEHTRLHMLRAAYEGVAFSLRDCLEALPPVTGAFYLAGGGANSDFLCQLVANTLNRPVLRAQTQEAGIQGMFRLLQWAAGGKQSAGPAGRGSRFLPDAFAHMALQKQYHAFKALQKTMLPHWEQQ